MPAPRLVMQTTYAELLERCATAALNEAFLARRRIHIQDDQRTALLVFQEPTGNGRMQRYAGPETPELLERIAHHKEARDDERERRALVSTLVRSFGLPRPIPEIANVIAALAKAGVFRLRGVLIGTAAYQTYAAMLGAKLPLVALQTGDVDIAQYVNVSAAIGDCTPPVLDVLKEVDKTFRAIPRTSGGRTGRRGGRPAMSQRAGCVSIFSPQTKVPTPKNVKRFRRFTRTRNRFVSWITHCRAGGRRNSAQCRYLRARSGARALRGAQTDRVTPPPRRLGEARQGHSTGRSAIRRTFANAAA